MVNKLLTFITGKELILYNPHRNSKPLLNASNREKYFFFNPIYIWKATAIVGRKSRLRYKLYYFILTFLNPVYVIDINWIDKLHSLYYVWCDNHQRSFVVIQHGIYHGGVVKFIPEKYVKCHVFLVWGEHFKNFFETTNQGKNFRCIAFGNPCYNKYNRAEFSYKENIGNRILIAVSVMKGKRLKALYTFLEKLENIGFEVTVKEHALQMQKASVSIDGHQKITGNLYNILKEQRYDVVVTDVSSAMTDIIFFKNRALYFSPEEADSDLNQNIYSDYLNNLALSEIESISSRKELLNYVDIEAQEKLLKYLIKTENTSNSLTQIEEFTTKSIFTENEESHRTKFYHFTDG